MWTSKSFVGLPVSSRAGLVRSVWTGPGREAAREVGGASKAKLIVVLAQTAGSGAMTGFIVTMQVLNSPLLALIAPADIPRYETAHNRRFAIVLAPGLI